MYRSYYNNERIISEINQLMMFQTNVHKNKNLVSINLTLLSWRDGIFMELRLTITNVQVEINVLRIGGWNGEAPHFVCSKVNEQMGNHCHCVFTNENAELSSCQQMQKNRQYLSDNRKLYKILVQSNKAISVFKYGIAVSSSNINTTINFRGV